MLPNTQKPRRLKKNRGTNAALVARSQAALGLFSFSDPFPPRQVVEHTYAQNFSVTGDASTANKLGTASTILLNDLFAPGGFLAHQPYGRDQMQALYGRFKVHSVIAEIEYSAAPSALPAPVLILGINAPTSGFTYSGAALTDAMEQPQAEWAQATTFPKRIVKKLDVATICGVTKQELGADVSLFSALAGATPTKTCSLSVAAAGLGGTAATTGIQVALRLTYRTEWFERITLSAS